MLHETPHLCWMPQCSFHKRLHLVLSGFSMTRKRHESVMKASREVAPNPDPEMSKNTLKRQSLSGVYREISQCRGELNLLLCVSAMCLTPVNDMDTLAHKMQYLIKYCTTGGCRYLLALYGRKTR